MFDGLYSGRNLLIVSILCASSLFLLNTVFVFPDTTVLSSLRVGMSGQTSKLLFEPKSFVGDVPKVIWTFWASYEVPNDVLTIIMSWKLISPGYDVYLVQDWNLLHFIDEEYFWVKSDALRSDLIRLKILMKYGGIWMDSTVTLTQSLNNILTGGFQAFYTEQYCTRGERDFIESWWLTAPANHPVISKWYNFLASVVKVNQGKTHRNSKLHNVMGIYDKERMIPYLKISRVIGGDAKYWAEYLAICAAFSHLYHKDKNFRHHVLNSDLTSSSKVGYFLQWKYRWNMTKFNSFLMSATSQVRVDQYDQLSESKLIKLSSSNMKNLQLVHDSGNSKETPCVLRKILRETNNKCGSRGRFQLVIARYDEDISWSDRYAGSRVIYNKGTPLDSSLYYYDRYYEVANIGRESETFLRYIIDNYYYLPKYVGFSQGDMTRTHDYVRPKDFGADMFIAMLNEAELNGYSTPAPTNPKTPGGDWGWKFVPAYKNFTLEHLSKARTLKDWFSENGWYDYVDDKLWLYCASYFVVSSTFIKSKSLSYYQNIHKKVNYSVNPREGHFMERSWFYVFNLYDFEVTKQFLTLSARRSGMVETKRHIQT